MRDDSTSIYSSELTDLEVSGDLTKSGQPGAGVLKVEGVGIKVFDSSGVGIGVEGVFDGAEVDGEEDSTLGWDLIVVVQTKKEKRSADGEDRLERRGRKRRVEHKTHPHLVSHSSLRRSSSDDSEELFEVS